MAEKTLRSFLQQSAEIIFGGGQVTLDPGRCRMVLAGDVGGVGRGRNVAERIATSILEYVTN